MTHIALGIPPVTLDLIGEAMRGAVVADLNGPRADIVKSVLGGAIERVEALGKETGHTHVTVAWSADISDSGVEGVHLAVTFCTPPTEKQLRAERIAAEEQAKLLAKAAAAALAVLEG